MSTKVVAKPILKPFNAEVVVAKVGHIPKSNTNVGFSFMTPLESAERYLFMVLLCSIRLSVLYYPERLAAQWIQMSAR